MATRDQCRRALDLFEDQLGRRANVVGLGIVPEDESGGSKPGDMAVAVYVEKKVAPDRLAPEEVVPPVLEIPGRRGAVRVPTKVIEQGKVRLEPVR